LSWNFIKTNVYATLCEVIVELYYVWVR